MQPDKHFRIRKTGSGRKRDNIPWELKIALYFKEVGGERDHWHPVCYRVRQEGFKMSSIIIADDNKILVYGLQRFLEKIGYEVKCAFDGEEFLFMCKGKSFDAAIVDYKMPRLDGLKAIKHLKDFSPDTKVILITGFVDSLDLEEAMRLGIYDCLIKPFGLDELHRSIDKALHDEVSLDEWRKRSLVGEDMIPA
ncbi:MAG: response regulator [Deltaproteobacteria bacterium]|nr:response regulator [Deltaproteobacteria bacterium]